MKKAKTNHRQSTSSRRNGKLFVSFWDICLDNLPDGAFVQRRIAPNVARRAIDKARCEGRLLCVSKDGVQAPQRMHQRENHNCLRGALKKHFGISLAFRDFTGSFKSSEGTMYSITPLECVQVEDGNRLLVVNCACTLDKRERRDQLSFSIAPDSIEFHLIESAPRGAPKTPKRSS